MNAMSGIEPFEQVMIYIVLATAFIALGYAYWLARQTFAADKGSQAMQRVWGFIRDGANAYLTTQLRTVVILIGILTVAMFLSVALVKPTGEANELFCRAAVEEAFAATIASNTGLSEAEALVQLEAHTAKQVALDNGFTDFNPERIAANVECSTAVWAIAIGRAVAFVMGASFSATVGFIGMNMAVQGNVREHVALGGLLRATYPPASITGAPTVRPA